MKELDYNTQEEKSFFSQLNSVNQNIQSLTEENKILRSYSEKEEGEITQNIIDTELVSEDEYSEEE